EFLQTGGTAAVAVSGVVGSQEQHERKGGHNGDTRYETEIPDTLDLAERAAHSVNALTGSAEPSFGYETPEAGHLDQRSPYMSWWNSGSCMQKPIHALPMMRIMSGSRLRSDYAMKMVQAVTRDVEADGLWWMKAKGH